MGLTVYYLRSRAVRENPEGLATEREQIIQIQEQIIFI